MIHASSNHLTPLHCFTSQRFGYGWPRSYPITWSDKTRYERFYERKRINIGIEVSWLAYCAFLLEDQTNPFFHENIRFHVKFLRD